MSRSLVYKALSALWFSSLLGALFVFLLQVTLARQLSVEQYGIFAAAFTLVALFIPLAGLGVAQLWLKSFGEHGIAAHQMIKPSFYVLLINLSLVGAVLVSWSLLGPHGDMMQLAIQLLFLYLCGMVALELLATRLQLEERYLTLSLWQVLPSLTRLLVILALIYLLQDAFSLSYAVSALAFVGLAMLLLSFIWLQPMIQGKIQLKGHSATPQTPAKTTPPTSIKAVYSKAWPFGVADWLHLILFQSDIILLQYLAGEQTAGYYNVAFIIIAATLLFPGVVYQRYLLPKMHRWAYHDPHTFHKVFLKGNRIMLAFGILAMLATWLLSPYFIPLVFGEKFTPSLTILNILALAIPILFLSSSYGAVLVTQDNIKTKVKLMSWVALLNITLNVLLIPQYAAMGAVAATLISYSVLLILYILASKKVFHVPAQ